MHKQAKSKLTKLQNRLLAEVTAIAELSRIDYENILDYDEEERTVRLRSMMKQIVRSQVIADYTFIDEMLGVAICHYFFGQKRGFIKLWKTKKFKNFNYYILEVLSITEKLRLVKATYPVPKTVAADIEAINALRNGLAHAFFPENLRSSKPVYKGKDIFTSEGLERFIEDMSKISSFFFKRNFEIKESQQEDQQSQATTEVAEAR
jgi:hypothetical protein